MFSKVVAFAALVACAQAGAPLAYAGAPALAYAAAPAAVAYGSVGAQSEHTVRGFGGLSTVSHQAKAVHTPFSHVHKHDTRVTNDALHAYAAPAIAAPVAHHAYAAPIAHQAYAAPIAHHAYAAPAIAHHGYAAPAIAAAPLAAHHAYAAPVAHHAYAAAPVAHAHHAYAAPAVAHHGLAHGYAAGLAPAKSLSYSPVSPAVATLSYATPYFTYGY